LLIFGDFFTNPLETLFYTGFNVTRCVDFRYYTEMGVLSYIQKYKPDMSCASGTTYPIFPLTETVRFHKNTPFWWLDVYHLAANRHSCGKDGPEHKAQETNCQ
jgi:hypothetical protein